MNKLCPNCGRVRFSVVSGGFCNCTWSEMYQASRREEVERRKKEPVKVDFISVYFISNEKRLSE